MNQRTLIKAAALFALSGLAVFAASDDDSSPCIAPTDEELIELAVRHMVVSQPGSVGTLGPAVPPYELRLETYPVKQSFLEANPECCEVFTKQAIGEYITPAQGARTKYAGSVRIRAVARILENSNPKNYPATTYAYTRIVHIDQCGKVINL